ncbi:hypothetical protein [Anaerotignum sp.]|uniref:hypothetical protein n=1 Tax=Anaerotignum sp. TaxID=2039241 RepID=UPI0027151460|nr:hypothetical protein [Anaerotignum sp.]
MINSNQFMDEVLKRGYTKEKLAKKINMNPQVFNKKLYDSCNCFTIKEVLMLVDILNLEGGKAEKIFFA